jgi:hypothetical protein
VRLPVRLYNNILLANRAAASLLPFRHFPFVLPFH